MTPKIPLPNGVFTASLTPLNADLSVNTDMLIQHCRWLLDRGSDGIALLGTTGEANSFSFSEKKAIMESIAKSDIPLDRVMVGTGACSYTETVELSRQAVNLGYGGLLMLPPFYYKNLTDEGLFQYMDLVIQSVGDERLKIYLYHIPQMTGVPFSQPLVKRLVKSYPNQVVGMKDSSGDWDNMKAICTELPGFKLYAGTEKYLLQTLEAGGAGCISATANATSLLAGKVYEAWKKETDASTLQDQLINCRKAFEGFVFVSALKSFFADYQQSDNWLPVRPPNVLLDVDQMNELKQRIKALGETFPLT